MLTWIDDEQFTIGDLTFRAAPWKVPDPTPESFSIAKRRDLVERYVSIVTELTPRNIVELGIYKGGSTAFLAELVRPAKLVAVDVSKTRVDALDQFLQRRGWADTVRAYYGVDQGDRRRLTEVVEREFGHEPLDLVVDDASHDVDLTRASFNVLFPRLRKGGVFIIEDWSWLHTGGGFLRSARPEEVPLTRLVFELVMACPSTPGLISDIAIDRDWTLIRRGGLDLDPDAFDISGCYSDRSRSLLAPGVV